MPLSLAPAAEARDLSGRLEELRRSWRRLLVVVGAGTIVALALGVVIVCGSLDALVNLPAVVRAAALMSVLTACGLAARRSVLRFCSLGDDLALALRVEEQFPELDDALASSLEFDRQPGGSPYLRRATLRRAERQARVCDFRHVIDHRPAIRVVGVVILVVAICATLAFVRPTAGRIAVLRIVDPFGDHAWPAGTLLTVDAPEWLPRGEPFVLRGELAGVIPERVTFGFALEGSSPSEQMVPVAESEGAGSFAVRLEPNRLPRTFRYRLRANDAAVSWRTVRVVTPPQLVPLDGRPSPQVHLTYPGYTDLPPVNVPDGGTACECVTGTMVRIRAATDRPVTNVWIELAGDSPRQVVAAGLLPLAAAAPYEALTAEAIGRAVVGRQPALVDGSQLDLSFRPYVGGLYQLRFADDAGLEGRRTIDLNVTLDPPPAVSIEGATASRDGLGRLPTATIPLVVVVEDPTFAVRRAWLEYRCGPEETVQRLPLYEHAEIGAALPKLLNLVAGPQRLRSSMLRIERDVDLGRVRHADGRPLVEGDSVIVQAAADDFDDVTVPKPAGRSHEVEIHIVGPAALLTAVQKGEADVQRRLQELVRIQREAIDQAAPAEARRRQEGALAADDFEKLVRAEELQQQLRTRLGDERDGLRATVERLRQALRDSPLPSTRDRDRLDVAAAELDRLSREELAPVEPLLSQARTEQGPVAPEARKRGPLPRAVEHQRNAERILRGLLEDMRPWTHAREVRADVAALDRDQDRLAQERAALESLGLLGKPPQHLPSDQRERLGRLAERQEALAERAGELLGKVDRQIAKTQAAAAARETEAAAHEVRAAEFERQPASPNPVPGANGEDPSRQARRLRRQAADARAAASADRREAEALAAAREAAQHDLSSSTDAEPTAGGSLPGRQRQAAEKLARNELGEARQSQEAADRMLKAVQDVLGEKADVDEERLAKKRMLEAADGELDRLTEDQDQLRGRVKAAEGIAEARQRRETLRQLAREQEELRERARDLAERLTRLRVESAADEVWRVARAMVQARDAMDDDEPAREKLDDSLDRLDEARDRLDQTRRTIEDELQREVAAKLVECLQGLKNRHQAHVAECERLFQEARQTGAWSRLQQKSLGDLAAAEAALANELDPLAKKQSETAKIIAHMLGEAADALGEVGPVVERMRDGPMDVDSWEADRRTVRDPQQLALKRLAQVLDALKDDPRNASANAGGKSNPGGAGGTENAVPSLAQLKLLRALQAELNERTASFAKQHPDTSKLTAAERVELEAIRKEQAGLADLVDDIDVGAPSGEGATRNDRGAGSSVGVAHGAGWHGAPAVNELLMHNGLGQTSDPPDRLEKRPRLPAKDKDAALEKPKPLTSGDRPPDAEQEKSASAAEVATKVLHKIVRDMQDAEKKLKMCDPGEATRRFQDDALHNLDKLIELARNPPPSPQQQPMSDNSPPPPLGQQQRSQSAQARRDRREARRRQMERQAHQSPSQPATGTGQPTGSTAPRQGRPGAAGARSERQPDQLADVVKDIWGHLPESMRQEVDHYYRDRFMPQYRDLVQEYYLRLAERDRDGREKRR
jgi:hypothetical protein